MNRLRSLLAVIALAFAPALVKADPITYTFNQSLTQNANNGTLTGTVTTDGTLGPITTANITSFDLFLTITANSQTQSVELSTALASGKKSLSGADSFNAGASILSFDFSQGSFVEFGGYGTGYVELAPNAEGGSINGFATLNAQESGIQTIATVVSTTPEPSSLALLGTGMAAMAGIARRRLAL